MSRPGDPVERITGANVTQDLHIEFEGQKVVDAPVVQDGRTSRKSCVLLPRAHSGCHREDVGSNPTWRTLSKTRRSPTSP